MKLIYSRRALADLDQIKTYYAAHASPAIAEAIGRRLEVSQRSQVRVIAVVRYPFRIFYRARDDAVDILHIRHTSRRPVKGNS